jgi:2-aminomuconate deaminase
MTQPSNVNSSRAAEPVGPYPHAKRVGDFLFLSGVGPRVRGTSEIPGVTRNAQGEIVDHDIEVQCRSCFENIRVIIEDAGAQWEQIVDVTTYLTHMRRDFAAYNRVYAEWFAGPGKPNPTRTTVQVGALPTTIAVELKVVVWLGGGRG